MTTRQGGPIQVQFELQVTDLTRMVWFQLRTSWSVWSFYALFLSISAVAPFTSLSLKLKATLVVVPLLAAPISLFAVPLTIKAMFRSAKPFEKRCMYRFYADRVEVIEEKQQTSFSWELVRKAAEGDDAFYLFLTSGVSHVVAKRGFSSGREMTQFRELVRNQAFTFSSRVR